jgi:uncharacterized protein with NRDE domain
VCLLAVLSRVVDAAPLVVAANRDEWLAREATAMTVLRPGGDGRHRVLGGRDHQAGGTWMAVNDAGVVAALTNQPSRQAAVATGRRSRGELPLLATEHARAEGAAAWLASNVRAGDFNPCWMLIADRRSVHYVDFTGTGAPATRSLEPGIIVLENRPLDEPSPKAAAVREAIARVLASQGATALAPRLHTVLASHEPPPDAPEPRSPLLAPCVHAGVYGTRSSEIVLVPADERLSPEVFFTERSPCVAPLEDARALWARFPG